MSEQPEQSGSQRKPRAVAIKGGPAVYVRAGGGGTTIDVDEARRLIDDLIRAIIEIGGRRS